MSDYRVLLLSSSTASLLFISARAHPFPGDFVYGGRAIVYALLAATDPVRLNPHLPPFPGPHLTNNVSSLLSVRSRPYPNIILTAAYQVSSMIQRESRWHPRICGLSSRGYVMRVSGVCPPSRKRDLDSAHSSRMRCQSKINTESLVGLWGAPQLVMTKEGPNSIMCKKYQPYATCDGGTRRLRRERNHSRGRYKLFRFQGLGVVGSL